MSRGPKEDPEGEKAQKVFPELCDRVNQEAGDEGIGVFRGEEGEDEVKCGFPGSKPRQALNGEEGGEFGSGDSDREEGSSGGRGGKVVCAYRAFLNQAYFLKLPTVVDSAAATRTVKIRTM